MKIARHPVQLEQWNRVFHRDLGRLDLFLEGARKDPHNLHLFLTIARTVYLAGSVLSPNSQETVRALKLASQAAAAMYIFSRLDSPPRSFTLGEGKPVIYMKPSEKSCNDLLTWVQAFHLTIITRQPLLTDDLCKVSNDVFRDSALGGSDLDYSFADLLRAVWTKEQFTEDVAFKLSEENYRCHEDEPSKVYLRCITGPYLEVLRSLEQRDEGSFNECLTVAINRHKEYWSSTEELRNEKSGFVSLQLTAAAALAWDRGMRFDVESDYTPTSWVRGDLLAKR